MSDFERVIIAAGGTGGHLYPGIALARELRWRGTEPVFIVREGDASREILAKEDIQYREIPISGMPRKISLKFFRFAWLLGKGLVRAWKLLKSERPKAIIGMGGYISFPVVVIGRLQGIPTVIHEQNYLPGLSNRILSWFTGAVAVSFDASLKYFPVKKTQVTGNPVRKELFSADPLSAHDKFHLSPDKFTVLIFGGSQGARGINTAATEAHPLLGDMRSKVQYLHIAGKKDFDFVKNQFREKNIPGAVLEYLHAIGDAYAAADLIICRSGATTVAELDILNKPAILVPFPHATANHQEFNARVLVDKGQAQMVLEADLTPQLVAETIAFKARTHVRRFVPPVLPSPLPQELLADMVKSLLVR